MSIGYLTTEELITAVKRKAMIPTSDLTFSNSDYLAFLNEEIKLGLVPKIMEVHEEFFVRSTTSALVASQSNYAIPYRAIGAKLRDVLYQDSAGNQRELTRISPDERTYYANANSQNSYDTFYVQADDIILVPSVGTTVSGSLVLTYYLRPNDLVLGTRVGIISAIATGASTTVYTIANIDGDFPTNFTSSLTYDFLQTKSGHKIRGMDLTPTAMSAVGFTITFDNDDIPSGVVVGDYIALSGECYIPNLPSDLHIILAERVAARCLEALGDQNGLAAANAKVVEAENHAQILIDNRVEGAPQKIVNTRGLLRSGGRFRRSW